MREEMNKNKVECLRLEGLIETHTKTEKDCRAERKKMESTSDTLRKSVSGSDAKLKELDQKIQKLEDTQKQGTHEDEMKELSDLIVQCDREIASLEFEEKRLHQERERAEKEDSKLEEVKLLRKRLVRSVRARSARISLSSFTYANCVTRSWNITRMHTRILRKTYLALRART